MWRQREQCEEALAALEVAPGCLGGVEGAEARAGAARAALKAVYDQVTSNQVRAKEKVLEMIKEFLPNDFRGQLLLSQKQRGEDRRAAEVEALEKAGGSIADKYALLWRQQQDRRKMLASLGSSSGAFKTLLSYIAGVPQALLDFVTTINDDNGPLSVQRRLYGPALYQLTIFATRLRVFVCAMQDVACRGGGAAPSEEDLALLESASVLYQAEMGKFLAFFREVFEKSPFMVTAEEARAVTGEKSGGGGDEPERVEIGRAAEHAIQLEVEGGTAVGWDWREENERDCIFRVEFTAKGAPAQRLMPDITAGSHEGQFPAPGAGVYTLTWTNPDLVWASRSLLISTLNLPGGADADDAGEA